MVQVKVGPQETLFNVHKKILCNVAPYFEAVFEGGFAEAKDQALSLPDEDPVMFHHFQLWVYTGNLFAKEETEAGISWESLVGLYIFGEMRGIPDLQNAAIDVLIDKNSSSKIIPTRDILPRLYNDTPEGSSLRRLFVDWMACLTVMSPNDRYTATPPGEPYQWFKEETRKNYPKDFLFDLVFALSELKSGKKPTISNFKLKRADYYVKPRNVPSNTPPTGQE